MEIEKVEKREEKAIMRDFTRRQTRQIVAIAAALFSVLLIAVLYKRPDIFGAFSKDALSIMQVIVVLAFVNFTSFNWRCPSCGKYLGSNINRRTCRKCGARLR